MARLRRGTSPWLDQYDGPRFSAPKLAGRHDADVVVIGGGITGCVAAQRLAARGLRVVVLEAEKIGRGSTAASTALLMQEPDVDFGDLSERYGRKAAASVWKTSRRAVQSMIRAIAGLRIPAALHRVPSVYFTRDDNEARALAWEARARVRAGRHLFALGYGGNGMTFGFLAGEMLARMIRGVAKPEDELFRFNRRVR